MKRAASPLEKPQARILGRLQVLGPEKYQTKVNYAQPTEIGCFSFNESRTLLLNDRSSLAYYTQPPLPSNLNNGYPEKWIKRPEEPERLDAFLKCFQSINKQRLKDNLQKLAPDFCTWRGIMTKFFACPYASDHWELGATLYNGTIYIVEHEDPNRNKFGDNEEQQRFTYYGYKFEQIATSDQEPNGSMERDQEPNGFMERDQGQVNTNVQFCSVFSTKLNQHRIVMGGEVDCLYRKRKEDKYSYCELKTNRVIVSDRQQRNLIKYKLLKTWIQSFLIGVKHVIFGYRDDQGLLQQIQVYETSELPRLARPEKLWDPFVCMSFADQILKMIKETVTIDDRETVYVIRYDARSRLVTIEGPHRQPDMVFVYEFEYTAEG